MYYGLIMIATVMFSVQFLLSQQFMRSYGTGIKATVVYEFYRSIAMTIVMLIIGGFKIDIPLFSWVMGLVYAAILLLNQYFGLKALSVANLSVYSVFSMLGGMLLPFVLGVWIYDDDINIFKIFCCVLIVAAIFLNVKMGKQNKKG